MEVLVAQVHKILGNCYLSLTINIEELQGPSFELTSVGDTSFILALCSVGFYLIRVAL